MEGPDAMKFETEFRCSKDALHLRGSQDDEETDGIVTMSLWEKLQSSLTPNLPRDLQSIEGQSHTQVQVQQQALSHFWAFLKGLLIPSV